MFFFWLVKNESSSRTFYECWTHCLIIKLAVQCPFWGTFKKIHIRILLYFQDLSSLELGYCKADVIDFACACLCVYVLCVCVCSIYTYVCIYVVYMCVCVHAFVCASLCVHFYMCVCQMAAYWCSFSQNKSQNVNGYCFFTSSDIPRRHAMYLYCLVNEGLTSEWSMTRTIRMLSLKADGIKAKETVTLMDLYGGADS